MVPIWHKVEETIAVATNIYFDVHIFVLLVLLLEGAWHQVAETANCRALRHQIDERGSKGKQFLRVALKGEDEAEVGKLLDRVFYLGQARLIPYLLVHLLTDAVTDDLEDRSVLNSRQESRGLYIISGGLISCDVEHNIHPTSRLKVDVVDHQP